MDKQSIEELRVNHNYASFIVSEDHNENENIPRIRRRMIPTEDLNNIIKQQFSFRDRSFILPSNCKFFKHYHEGGSICVIEEQPQVRTILVDLSMEATVEKLRNTGKLKLYGFEDFLTKNKRPFQFYLSFPYIVYFVGLDCKKDIRSMKIFYRLSPLSSCSDYLLQTNLLNVGRNNTLCNGIVNPQDHKISTVVDESIYSFWSNSFNDDITYKYRKYQDVYGVEDFLTWSYNTKLDPMFIFDVEWIPDKMNVQDVLHAVEHDLYGVTNNFNLMEILKHTTVTNKKESPTSEIYLERNITDSIVVGNYVINVGESFIYKNGKEVFINSFDGRNDIVRNIQMEKWDGKLVNLKLTDKVKMFIENQLSKKKYIDSAELPNGDKIKIGDILEMDFPFKSFREVESMRIARDGKMEVKLGSDFYLLDTLQASILNENKIEFNGLSLEKNKEYILIQHGFKTDILKSASRSKFVGVQPSKDLRIVSFNFVNVISNEEDTIDPRFYDFIPTDKLESINGEVFSVGSFLYKTTPNLYRYNNKLVEINNSSYTKLSEPSPEDILSCVKEDRIIVPNISSETELKIGDEIVVADWLNLDELLIVRKIESFEIIDEDIVYINAIDTNQNRSQIPYINVGKCQCSIGYVRRIIDKYDGLTAGMKIKSKEKGISNFPLKDTNMIVGFLNDTGGVPLVLCSNGCTLWPDVVKNFFEIIQEDSPMWKTLDVVPIEPNKIKFQAGDILISSRGRQEIPLYVLTYHRSWRFPRLIEVYNLKNPDEYYMRNFDSSRNYYKRYGFPSPRYTQNQMGYKPRVHGIPSMCNTYFLLKDCEISFPANERIESV